jgi:MFS family permease
MLSGTSMLVLIAGIIGHDIAPYQELATLPIALTIVGLALNTVPVSMLMSRYGRKRIYFIYGALGVASALLASYALSIQHFWLFCLAAIGVGSSAASVQHYRFAAIELVDSQLIPKTASTILLGGIVAAIIGPELSLLGKNLLSIDYTGSFILLAMVYLVGLSFLSLTKNSTAVVDDHEENQRSLLEILNNSNIILAITAAAVGYAVMSFIMTATPLSMHNHYDHSLVDTKRVIQSHVIAMYLPSLFSGKLIERLGHKLMMMLGLIAFLACLIIAYYSQTFFAFWTALILLGIGWNFLFVAGTSLLATSYRANEKFKVQASNDFIVFGSQAIAALSSGWLLFEFQWQGILLLSLLPIFIVGLVIFIREK